MKEMRTKRRKQADEGRRFARVRKEGPAEWEVEGEIGLSVL